MLGVKGGFTRGLLRAAVVAWLLLASVLGLARGAMFTIFLAIVVTPMLLMFLGGRGAPRRLATTGLVTITALLLAGLVTVSASDNPYRERLAVFSSPVALADYERTSRWGGNA